MANENLKLQNLIDALNNTKIAQCEIPIMFQDVHDENTKALISEYQGYISVGNYLDARYLRT